MKPRSNTLFHFTKSKETLFKIFRNGYWPRFCLEDIRWQGFPEIDFVAFPMVCFCDIPIARISEHIAFYGGYGLGMKREWAEKNNLNPVFYISPGAGVSQCLQDIAFQIAETSTEDSDKDNVFKHYRYLVSHTKPTSGEMILVSGDPVTKEFYLESEWRYVPQKKEIPSHLGKKAFEEEEKLRSSNESSLEYGALEFLPTDVSYVFVPKDSDIPNIINFMQNELDQFPNADLKVLFSRVISIESINRDI